MLMYYYRISRRRHFGINFLNPNCISLCPQSTPYFVYGKLPFYTSLIQTKGGLYLGLHGLMDGDSVIGNSNKSGLLNTGL
eukprot:snap_masked-scaffold_18-processed-gene-3.20-mRNA-1 protein AED:1.00 eAED:1.00 QI:0/0/0/0/1/1/2/0/79